MTIETEPWSFQDLIATREGQLGYLAAALKDGDSVIVAGALADIVQARGAAHIAREAGITGEELDELLLWGAPSLSTLFGVLKALGIRLAATTA